MQISILDHENGRAIVSQVPDYLTGHDLPDDDLAQVIFDALGISSAHCDYMIGDFTALIDSHTYNLNNVAMHKIEELTQCFKSDALESLANMLELNN